MHIAGSGELGRQGADARRQPKAGAAPCSPIWTEFKTLTRRASAGLQSAMRIFATISAILLAGCTTSGPLPASAIYTPRFTAALADCAAKTDAEARRACYDRVAATASSGAYEETPPPSFATIAPAPPPRPTPALTPPPSYTFAPPSMPAIPAGREDNTMRPGVRPPFCGLGSGADQINGICR